MEHKPRDDEYLGHPTYHLTRELEIELDEIDIYFGTALVLLSRAPFDGCALPLVRRITFTIHLGDSIRAPQSVVVANISASVRWIKQMAPIAKDIQLSPKANGVIDHSTGHYFDDLAMRFFQPAEQIELIACDVYLYHGNRQLSEVHNLVSMKYTA